METALIQPMTEVHKARVLLDSIRNDCQKAGRIMNEMRERIILFDQNLYWRILGYPSLSDCFEKELGVVFQTGYAQLRAAMVEINIRRLSPVGEILVTRSIPVRHVKETRIGNLPPEGQLEAYRNAVRLAKAEGKDTPTTEHVNRGVELEETKGMVFQCKYKVISQMVATGSITAALGQQMEAAVDELKPKQRGYIVQLIAKFKMTCPALFKPIANMFDRKPGEESKVLPEVMTGYLAGIPLAQAAERDLKRANEQAAAQHQAEQQEAERLRKLAAGEMVIEWKTVSLPIGDWKKCIEVLRRDLGDVGFDRLMKAGMAL